MGSLRRLFLYASSFRSDITLATTYSVLNKILDIVPEVLIGVAVDIVVNRKESFLARLGLVDVLAQLIALGAVTLVVFAMESVFQYLYQVKWRNLAQALQHSMRLDAYDHAQKLDMAYFEDKSTGSLLSIINDDINQLERFLDGGANAMIQVMASTVIIGIIFFYISPAVALMALMPMPLIVFMAYRFQKTLGPRYAKVREWAGLISARLSNNFQGMFTIRSYSKESYEKGRLGQDSLAYQEANRAAIHLSSAFIPIIRMAIVAGFIATMILGGYFVINNTIAIASYSVLIFLTQRLLWPFTRLAEMTDLYQRAMASADRVLDLLSSPIRIREGNARLLGVTGAIDFENVSFAYPNGKKVLDNFRLSIKSGQTIAFVGATGAGKSTLIKLLMRFYEPVSGKICIDGEDIAKVKLSDLRKAISFVSQDAFLFGGSILENIAYGSPDPSFSDVVASAKTACAHDFIETQPQGYLTEVGERGQKLSGGQKQRLSIARAVLKNSPIFILDEATSSVDNETEEAIQRSLNRIVHKKTTIIIAHRLSTIRHADHIYVLHNGAIAESGTHEKLCDLNGIYARLWQIQTGEQSQITTFAPRDGSVSISDVTPT
jgi:ATP-binding cassette subfamily B protein